MPKRDQLPLPAEGFSRFNDAAHEHDDHQYRVIGQLLLHCGLRNGTAGHMHEDWIEHGPHGMQVRVPKQWPCNIGQGGQGCYHCKKETSRGPPDTWKPKSESGTRVVPIPNDFYDYHLDKRRSIELPQLLDSYFHLNNGINTSTSKISEIVHHLARDAGLEKIQGRGMVERTHCGRTEMFPDVTPHDLRGSWACQLVRSDVNRFRARDWGGWADVAMLNKYAKFVGGGDGSDREKY